jgi:hypothetical protein
MHRTARATLAAVAALLLCGRALSQEKVRLPRKGSSPGFEMRSDAYRYAPLQGDYTRSSREAWERWERRERERREWERARRERLERERREREARLERRRLEARRAYCSGLADSARSAQEDAKRRVVVGYLAGGLIGALIASSQSDDAYKDVAVVWQEAYDSCMGIRRQQDERDNQEDDDE